MGIVFAGLLLGVPLVLAIIDLSRTRAHSTSRQPYLPPTAPAMVADSQSLLTEPQTRPESGLPVSHGFSQSGPRLPAEA